MNIKIKKIKNAIPMTIDMETHFKELEFDEVIIS